MTNLIPPESNLDDIRTGLDECSQQLLELFALKLRQSNKTWEQIKAAPADQTKEQYFVDFYRTIADGVQDPVYSQRLKDVQTSDHAVQRILTGSDFQDDPLTGEAYAALAFFFDLSNGKLVKIIRERFGWIEQVSYFKKANNLDIRHPDRELELIARNQEACKKLGLPEELASIMYKYLILPVALEIEEMIVNS